MIICPHDFLVKLGMRPTHDETASSWRAAYRAFARAVRHRNVQCAGIICGIPGAGKTTWGRAYDDSKIVLFDAVWSRRAQRESFAARVTRHGRQTIAVHVHADIETAIARVAQRSIGRVVPTAKIRIAAALFSAFPPVSDRGWARVIDVQA